MPILHDMQEEHRCIPHQAMIEIAKFLEITPGDVLDTVSFYEEFTVEPTGKYVIAVCQSIACEVCGHQAVLDHLRNRSWTWSRMKRAKTAGSRCSRWSAWARAMAPRAR